MGLLSKMGLPIPDSPVDSVFVCGFSFRLRNENRIQRKIHDNSTDTGYEKIYDYPEKHRKVVYTAVIAKHPKHSICRRLFTITGLAKGTGDETEAPLLADLICMKKGGRIFRPPKKQKTSLHTQNLQKFT